MDFIDNSGWERKGKRKVMRRRRMNWLMCGGRGKGRN